MVLDNSPQLSMSTKCQANKQASACIAQAGAGHAHTKGTRRQGQGTRKQGQDMRAERVVCQYVGLGFRTNRTGRQAQQGARHAQADGMQWKHPGHSTWRVAHPKVAVLVGRILGLPLRLLKMVEDGPHESTVTQASGRVCFDEATWGDVGGRGRYPKFEPHSSLFQFRTHLLDRFVNKLPLRHAHQMVINDM